MAFDVVTQISKSDAARMLGSLGAKKGGIARKAKLSNERLTEIGKLGAATRWGKQKEKLVVPPVESE